MKKASIILLTIAMIFSLVGCKKEVIVIDDDESMSISEAEVIELPEGAKEAYETAIVEYTDQKLEPIGYLGSQVVAGINYKYLVRDTDKEQGPNRPVYVVVVYQDLDGNVEVTQMNEVKFANYYKENKKLELEELVGGWYVEDAYGSGIDGLCKEAFNKATESYKDYELEPICLMNFELFQSYDFIILCKASDGNASGLCVVTIKEDLKGTNSKISCINAFE